MNRKLRVESREWRDGAGGLSVLAALATAIGLLSLVGCAPTGPSPDEPYLFAKARAAVAFAEAEIERRPDARPTNCDACGGTGTVPSGDGLARVPCECGESCRCEPARTETAGIAAPAPRRKRLLYFTAAWCPTCRANEPTFAALAGRGWSIGPGEENHVQIVDLDARADLRTRYGIDTVPAWVLIDGDRELRHRYGPLDPFAVGRLFGG